MRLTTTAAFLTLMSLALTGRAEASGSVSCTIAHASLKMDLEGVVSHGVGEQLTEVRGDVAVSDPLITSGLKAHKLERQDVTQFWLTGRNLKIRTYRDSTDVPGESLEVILEAVGKGQDELSYNGIFKAILSKLETGKTEAKTRTIQGKVTCSSE